jgi:Outer membrane protein beta-barrel domain
MKRGSWAVGVALLVGALVVQPARAQWNGGFTLGGTYTNVSGSGVDSAAYRWGGTIGAFLGYMPQNFMVRVEGNFVGRGGDKVVLGSDPTPLTLSLTYIEIPVLAGPVFRLGDAWIWELFAGIAPAFSTKCSVQVSGGAGATPCEAGLPGGTEKSSTASVPIGTSLDYAIPESKVKFIFDGRYYLGLSEIMEGAAVKTSGFQFLLRLQVGGV